MLNSADVPRKNAENASNHTWGFPFLFLESFFLQKNQLNHMINRIMKAVHTGRL
jgi:hypothetical protein